MRLETADRDYDSIDDFTIKEAVQAVADLKTDFAILTLDDNSFMQAGGGTGGLVLEYRDANTDEQFVARGQEFSAEDIVAAFESFASGDDAYKEAAKWELLEQANGRSGCGSAVLLIVALPALGYLLL